MVSSRLFYLQCCIGRHALLKAGAVGYESPINARRRFERQMGVSLTHWL